MNSSMNATNWSQVSDSLIPVHIPIIFLVWDILDTLLAIWNNGITIFILITNELLETPSNILIACLSLGDMFSAAALPFRIAAEFLIPGTAWKICCFINLLIDNASSLINIITIFVIAVDRLIYFVRSLEYNSVVPVKRAAYMAYAIWVFSIVFIAAVLGSGYQYYDLDNGSVKMCTTYYGMNVVSKAVYSVIYPILIPVTIGIYIKIGLVAWEISRRVAPAIANQPPQPPPQDYKITKVMLNVLVIYITCNLALLLLPIVFNNLPEHLRPMAVLISSYIWRINRWVNPFIYAGKSKKFRGYVRKLFGLGSSPDSQPPWLL